MKKFFLMLLLGSTMPATAATISAGEIYSFTFDTLYLTNQNPDGVIDNASVGYTKVFDINNPVDYILEIRLYEDSDPLSTPFAITQAVDPVRGVTFLGFNWPADTWSDLNGLVEVEVLQGTITTPIIQITIEDNGFVYSSVQPVPVPAAVWLFGSGLLGLIAVAKRT